ncbi:MAG TPA: deoxyribonuclease IV, partial [Armatimonadota bacterium]|nr:deoxyribonuclease IV [Armatimonadota bacterium]
DHDIQPVFVHACYLINLASPDRTLYLRSIRRLARDLRHAAVLGCRGVVVHLGSPGKHSDKPRDWCIERVAKGVDAAVADAPDSVKLLLENSAGMGNGIGSSYTQIGDIISAAKRPDRLAACIDTAHSFAAGYGWDSAAGLQAALDEIDDAFGLGMLALLHVNDSRTERGSKVDRHWHIGKGEIGLDGFRAIVNHPALRHLPMVMETPEASVEADMRNLKALRRCIRPEFRPPLRPAPSA